MKKLFLIFVCCMGLGVCQVAKANFSDQLRFSDGELVANGDWANVNTYLDYTVTGLQDGWWAYSYTLNVGRSGEISHLIIEVSENATQGEFRNWSYDNVAFDDYSGGNGNPGLPYTLNGIKFDETAGTSLTVSFESSHAPMWGDFYAKDGQATSGGFNFVYNAGIDGVMGSVYLGPDFDGVQYPSPYPNKILVPDTITVPDGGATAALVGLGILGLGYISRRKA